MTKSENLEWHFNKLRQTLKRTDLSWWQTVKIWRLRFNRNDKILQEYSLARRPHAPGQPGAAVWAPRAATPWNPTSHVVRAGPHSPTSHLSEGRRSGTDVCVTELLLRGQNQRRQFLWGWNTADKYMSRCFHIHESGPVQTPHCVPRRTHLEADPCTHRAEPPELWQHPPLCRDPVPPRIRRFWLSI